MRNSIFYFILLITLASLLQSCALIKTTPTDINAHINELLAENKFSEIDDVFESASETHPQQKQLAELKPTIKIKKDEYINNTIKTATTQKNNNEWQAAVDTYEDALLNIRNDAELKNQFTMLLKERDLNVLNLRKDLLMKNANALISYKKIYDQLYKLIPEDYSAQFDISRYESNRIETADQLEKCAEQAIHNKDYNLAKECYFLSNMLLPTQQKTARIERLESIIKNYSNQKLYSKLLNTYKSEYAQKNYNQARKSLRKVLKLNPEHAQAKKYLADLSVEINTMVNGKLSLGRDFYSKKKVDAALVLWKQAQKLDPENEEINQLISRAEKVRKKIETLENNQ